MSSFSYTENVIKEENTPVKSRVAVLGTLAELHQEPIKYNLQTLRRLVKDLKPDLLCAEIHPDDWKKGDVDRFSPEYRETLLPLSRRTDIVVVPVSESQTWELISPIGGSMIALRKWIVRLLNGQLKLMQRLANGPRSINSGVFGWFCDGICTFSAWVCGEQAQVLWEQSNLSMLNNIITAIHRDPGRRVLVTVDCRRRHLLERKLHHVPELEVVSYTEL